MFSSVEKWLIGGRWCQCPSVFWVWQSVPVRSRMSWRSRDCPDTSSGTCWWNLENTVNVEIWNCTWQIAWVKHKTQNNNILPFELIPSRLRTRSVIPTKTYHFRLYWVVKLYWWSLPPKHTLPNTAKQHVWLTYEKTGRLVGRRGAEVDPLVEDKDHEIEEDAQHEDELRDELAEDVQGVPEISATWCLRLNFSQSFESR